MTGGRIRAHAKQRTPDASLSVYPLSFDLRIDNSFLKPGDRFPPPADPESDVYNQPNSVNFTAKPIDMTRPGPLEATLHGF